MLWYDELTCRLFRHTLSLPNLFDSKSQWVPSLETQASLDNLEAPKTMKTLNYILITSKLMEQEANNCKPFAIWLSHSSIWDTFPPFASWSHYLRLLLLYQFHCFRVYEKVNSPILHFSLSVDWFRLEAVESLLGQGSPCLHCRGAC